MTMLISMAAKPTLSEMRPAVSRRAARSRPSWSVPRTCRPVSGGAKRLRMSMCSSSKGISDGPTAEARIRRAIASSPKTASRCRQKRLRARLPMGAVDEGNATASCIGSIQPDARIGHRAKQVRQEIADKHQQGGKHQDAHHHRIVAITQGIEEEAAHAGPGEDGLSDQSTAQERRQL